MAILTDEHRALIGTVGEPVTAPVPLTEETLRRFTQAVMDPSPLSWDVEAATASRYGGLVAPPLYPLHAMTRPAGSPDPLDRLADDPDWDGTVFSRTGLPPVELPLKRLVNGGTEATFHRLARVGDVITAQHRYADISEREGRSGPMVIVATETRYTNQNGELLAVVTRSAIWR